MANAPTTYRDYGRLKIVSEYQLKEVLEKIPVPQLQPEDWKETGYLKEQVYPYVDATPPALRNVKLGKLFWTEVDWRLLTDVRSTSEFDDNFFSRLVELEKFKLYSRAMELRKIKYNKEEDDEEIVELTASSVSYTSFCRHLLEDIDKEINVVDQVDSGQDLLDSVVQKETSD